MSFKSLACLQYALCDILVTAFARTLAMNMLLSPACLPTSYAGVAPWAPLVSRRLQAVVARRNRDAAHTQAWVTHYGVTEILLRRVEVLEAKVAALTEQPSPAA